MIAARSDGYSRYSHADSKRSVFHSLTHFEDLRSSYQLLAQDEIISDRVSRTDRLPDHQARP